MKSEFAGRRDFLKWAGLGSVAMMARLPASRSKFPRFETMKTAFIAYRENESCSPDATRSPACW
jgi:hypothetical protein